jgi:hypothetical protein
VTQEHKAMAEQSTTTMMTKSLQFSKLALLLSFLLVALAVLENADAFVPRSLPHYRRRTMHMAATTTTMTFGVEIVSNEDRVLDVASFRNGLMNPELMVKKAQEKRDSLDTTKEAVEGLKMGLGIIGPIIALATYAETRDLALAATNYGK